MPAINPHSEYKKKFRWHDSVKSASFTPTKQQSAETAGLSSFDFAKTFAKVREPALQHKKRPNFETTYSTRILPEPLVGHENENLQPSPLKSALRHPPKTAPRPRNDSNFNNNSKTRVIYSKKDKENDLPSNTQNSVMEKENDDKQGTRNEKEKNEVNRAMQFQAGIRAPQSGGPKYNTEYQRQFAWKKPVVKQSPLIAAEQMVYSSNTNISPYVPDKIQRSSEYQNQFQPWKIQGPKNERDKLKKIAEREIKAKYKIRNKKKKKRLSPEKMTAAGVPSTIVHEDPGLLKRIQNPQAPFFPHATLKKWKSEYNSNFKSPAKFKYSHGAWKGADPPHIQPRDDSSYRDQINDKGDNIQAADNQTYPNWFKEVAELRERAKQYKKRARGTHFSREHLAQLLAEQAKLWDQPDNGNDTPHKNDKEQNMVPAGKASNKDDLTPHVETSEDDTERPTRRKLAWGKKNNQNDNNNDDDSSIGSIPTPPDQRDSVSSSSNLEITDENGRVPTPELPDKGIKRRHHFDRTTPYTGGALLTSPQPSRKAVVSSPVPKDPLAEPIYRPGNREYAVDKSPPRYKGGHIKPGITYKKDQGSSDECNDDDDITPVKATSRPSKATEPLAASPTAGIRSRDPDPLNDDLSEHSFNRHSNNYFQTSPGVKYLPGTGSPPRTWAAPRQQATHKEQTRPSGGPLDKAHTKSLQGRPLTAKPMSRDQAHQIENQPSDDDASSVSSARQARGKLAAKSTRTSRPRTDHTRDNIHPSLGVSKLDDSPASDQLSMSAISSVSSCSLASDILDRARNRRDKFWGK